MEISELTKQAPYIAAIVIIVWAFLRAQEKRDEMFLKAQSERDALFLKSIHNVVEVTASLTNDVQKNTEILIAHDSTMQAKMKSLERARKAK